MPYHDFPTRVLCRSRGILPEKIRRLPATFMALDFNRRNLQLLIHDLLLFPLVFRDLHLNLYLREVINRFGDGRRVIHFLLSIMFVDLNQSLSVKVIDTRLVSGRTPNHLFSEGVVWESLPLNYLLIGFFVRMRCQSA